MELSIAMIAEKYTARWFRVGMGGGILAPFLASHVCLHLQFGRNVNFYREDRLVWRGIDDSWLTWIAALSSSLARREIIRDAGGSHREFCRETSCFPHPNFVRGELCPGAKPWEVTLASGYSGAAPRCCWHERMRIDFLCVEFVLHTEPRFISGL